MPGVVARKHRLVAAARLAAQPGFGGYEVLTWQTGIESARPFPRRVAYGEIRLVRSATARATP